MAWMWPIHSLGSESSCYEWNLAQHGCAVPPPASHCSPTHFYQWMSSALAWLGAHTQHSQLCSDLTLACLTPRHWHPVVTTLSRCNTQHVDRVTIRVTERLGAWLKHEKCCSTATRARVCERLRAHSSVPAPVRPRAETEPWRPGHCLSRARRERLSRSHATSSLVMTGSAALPCLQPAGHAAANIEWL